MMWFVFGSALVNAWILYKATRKKCGLSLDYSNFEFRRAIVLALVSEWEDMGCCSTAKAAILSPTKEFKSKPAKQARKSFSFASEESDRFFANDKHIKFCDKIPPLESSKSKKRPMQCQQCREKRTIYWCKMCTTPLWYRNSSCFVNFHTKSDP